MFNHIPCFNKGVVNAILVGGGKGNKEIDDALFLRELTTKTQRKNFITN